MHPRVFNSFITCLAALAFAVPAGAQEPTTQLPKPDTQEQAGTPKTASKSQDPKPDAVTYQVEVVGAVPRTAASSTTLRSELFSHTYVESPADLLRAVPGLVIAQHAGGGKSDQYLVRGFDADHGTDVALWLDGVPVNMVSHGHGQGYADLHFVIPETIERIDVSKGPYFAEYGNLATAAAIVLRTRERFEHSFIRFQAGSFGTSRLVFGLSPKASDTARTTGFLAGEGVYTRGPFRHPQDFSRFSAMTRWRFRQSENQRLTVAASAYRGRWDDSGQIPARLADAGLLDRFDAIDPSEGGTTSRYQASATIDRRWNATRVVAQGYGVKYDLDLFSNFTFFAVDPEHGDGILQRDDRSVWGGHLQLTTPWSIRDLPTLVTVGSDLRYDRIAVGLLRQQSRTPLATLQDSDVREVNGAFYAQQELFLGSKVRVIGGVRHERFAFDVRDRRTGGPQGTAAPGWTGPKASVIVTPLRNQTFELFGNYGRGLHSNDARAAAGGPRALTLPAAHGAEVGARKTLGQRLELSAALWRLDLDGEFVWAGDEGTTGLSGSTHRHGLDLEARYRIAPGVWGDVDVTMSTGRYRETGDAIARAPRLTLNTGLVVDNRGGWSGQARLRHVGGHPAVEDRSVDAHGFTVVDGHLRRRLGPSWDALLTVENLFDVDFREAQTFFSSRLKNEENPVGDIHFTPGTPRAIRLGLEYRW
jgi:outer membrane receptor protein involved in Fe transport